MPIGTTTTAAREQTIENWAETLSQHFGTTVGNSFVTYANDHPNLSPTYAAQQWANLLAASYGPNLANVVNDLATEGGQAETQITAGTEAGLTAVAAGQVCHRPGSAGWAANVPVVGQAVSTADWIGYITCILTQPQTWLRVAEVVIGGGLIYVTVSALAKGTPIAPVVQAPAKIAKTAAKVVK